MSSDFVTIRASGASSSTTRMRMAERSVSDWCSVTLAGCDLAAFARCQATRIAVTGSRDPSSSRCMWPRDRARHRPPTVARRGGALQRRRDLAHERLERLGAALLGDLDGTRADDDAVGARVDIARAGSGVEMPNPTSSGRRRLRPRTRSIRPATRPGSRVAGAGRARHRHEVDEPAGARHASSIRSSMQVGASSGIRSRPAARQRSRARPPRRRGRPARSRRRRPPRPRRRRTRRSP